MRVQNLRDKKKTAPLDAAGPAPAQPEDAIPTLRMGDMRPKSKDSIQAEPSHGEAAEAAATAEKPPMVAFWNFETRRAYLNMQGITSYSTSIRQADAKRGPGSAVIATFAFGDGQKVEARVGGIWWELVQTSSVSSSSQAPLVRAFGDRKKVQD